MFRCQLQNCCLLHRERCKQQERVEKERICVKTGTLWNSITFGDTFWLRDGKHLRKWMFSPVLSAKRLGDSHLLLVDLLPQTQASDRSGEFLSLLHWCTSGSHATALFTPAVPQRP